MKLPSVFANKIDKEINNNESYYHKEANRKEKKDINDLKLHFDRKGYANKLLVNIKTARGSSKEKLILLKNDYVININNQKIKLDDIIDYEIIK